MSDLSTEPYKGVRDFYPEDWGQLQAMFRVLQSVLEHWGYSQYNASPLERSEIYEKKTSEEIVSEQTYTFEDRGGRRVTLRPEMTPTLARMIAAKRRELALPARWFSIGNRFRYERPQRGRLREFYQTDIDFVGLPEGEPDLEVIEIASQLMKAFGAGEKDFIIRLNSRPLLNAACAAAGFETDEARRGYLRLLDRKSKMTPEEFEAGRGAGRLDPLRFIEEGDEASVELEKKKVLDMIQTLATRGVGNIVFDPEITRGFDYYTGMVFEIYDTNPENPRALFGGGRYDGLVAMYGGDPIPAVGFALGDVTLADFLTTHGLLPTPLGVPQIYIGTESSSDIPGAQALAGVLRSESMRVFVNLSARTEEAQIKEAAKRGIPLFLAFGDARATADTVRIKVSTGEWLTLPLAELPALVAAHA